MASKEVEVINRFIKSGILRGWFIGEVPVGLEAIKRKARGKGYSEKEIDMVKGVYSKKIDLICVLGVNKRPIRVSLKQWEWVRKHELMGKSVWLLEAKRRLSAEALGQILVNDYLFKRDNPGIRVVGLGIICEDTDELVEEVCKKYGVMVFRV